MIYLSFFQVSKTYKYGSYNCDLGVNLKITITGLLNWVMFRRLQSHIRTKTKPGKLPPPPPPPLTASSISANLQQSR